MDRVVAAFRRDLLAVLVSYFLGRWIARGVNYVLAPNVYVELQTSLGVPSIYIGAIFSSIAIGSTIGYVVPAMKKRVMNWLFLFSAIVLIAVVTLPILYFGLSGLIDPRFMLLGIPLSVAGVLALTSQFFPEDYVATS